MPPRRKLTDETMNRVSHPARPIVDRPDIKAMYERTMKRFPQVMARLAE